jgi:hypothetical protein
MSFTQEELQALNGCKSTPKAKRPDPNQERQQEQLDDINAHSRQAISALAQSGVNTINTQVFDFDSKLTRFERDTAKAMAHRLRQSPLRIQQYLMEELEVKPQECQSFGVIIDDALEVPDLTSNFLAIVPSSIAGALPL